MKILVINAGSSSLKYQLIDMENESLLAKGLCERIGIDGRLTHKPQNGKPVFASEMNFPTHQEAIEAVLAKGDRVELIPVKDGIKVIHIKRKEVKPEQ